MHAGQHALAQAARALHRLAVEQPVLHVGKVPSGVRFFVQGFELRPEELLRALFLRVLVETGASGATGPLVLAHHVGNQHFTRAGHVGLALGLEVGARLLHHVQAQVQGHLIHHRQRTHRHAALHGRVLDCRCRDAFTQHRNAFHDKGAEDPAGEETARVVHHDRHLADRLHIVKGARHGFIVGLLAANDLDQFHLVDRAEEMDADEFFGGAAGRGQAADRQRGGVGGEEAAWRQQRLGLLRDFGFELTVLEHRLDDQVAAGQIGRLAGGLNARQQLLLIVGAHAALVDARLGQLGAVGPAGLGLLLADVLEDRGDALAGLGEGNAGPHHAGAEHADLCRLEARRLAGARLGALDGVQVEEEGVDHGAGVGAGHEPGQMAALDAQRGGHIHLQAFDHAGHDRLGRGVEAARLLLDHRRRDHQHLGHRRARRQAAGHLVALGLPRVLGARVGGNPGQRPGPHLGGGLVGGRDQVVHQAQALGFLGREGLALHQVGLRPHQPEVARHLGHAAGARKQAERDLGQAELDLAVVDRDAVMADQRHLPAAAQGRAVEATHHRLAQRFEGPEVFLHAFDFGEDGARVGHLKAHRTLQVGTGEKC